MSVHLAEAAQQRFLDRLACVNGDNSACAGFGVEQHRVAASRAVFHEASPLQVRITCLAVNEGILDINQAATVTRP